jgi:hypothetical protein
MNDRGRRHRGRQFTRTRDQQLSWFKRLKRELGPREELWSLLQSARSAIAGRPRGGQDRSPKHRSLKLM